jgi:hypothetical protein
MRLIVVSVMALMLYSCDDADKAPSTPPIPPTPIIALGELKPQTTEISGELGQYLKIIDKAYEIQGNNKEMSLTITVEATKPTGPINTGGWMCAEMSVTLLNDKQMPISEIRPFGAFEGNNELRDILTSGSGQAFIRFYTYLTNADSLIKKSASSFMISGKLLTDHIATSEVNDKSTITESEEVQITMTSTQEAVSTDSASENVKELADEYCDWSEKEADAKDRDDDNAARAADDKVDEIRRKAYKLSSADLSKFRELTKDCKDHH